jgi:hypothetical protein
MAASRPLCDHIDHRSKGRIRLVRRERPNFNILNAFGLRREKEVRDPCLGGARGFAPQISI